MTIENNLTRIANALETLVGMFEISTKVSAPAKKPAAKKPAGSATVPATSTETKTSAPAAATNAGDASSLKKPATVPTPPTPPTATVTPAASMTPAELNTALQGEFTRLGSQDGIRDVMKSMELDSISDLSSETCIELLNKVKAL